jgi:hypothetical protein
MFKVSSEKELLDAFRPKDRKKVDLPRLQLPLFVRDYLAWSHPAGGWAYLVFAVPGGVPTGNAFETNGQGAAVWPQLCDWCHCSGPAIPVGLLTAQVHAKKRVGVNICSDLQCKARLEEEAERQGRSVVPMMEKLIARMGRFASEGLQIDLTGVGR